MFVFGHGGGSWCCDWLETKHLVPSSSLLREVQYKLVFACIKPNTFSHSNAIHYSLHNSTHRSVFVSSSSSSLSPSSSCPIFTVLPPILLLLIKIPVNDLQKSSLEKMHDEVEFFLQLGHAAAIIARVLHPHVLRCIIY